MQFSAIIILTLFAHAHSKLLQLNCNDIREFVNGHNQRRLDIARGKVQGQPGATKMAFMVWDAELAEKAASWASKLRHDHNPNRKIGSRRFRTGENLHWHTTSDRDQSDHTISISQGALDGWFNEYKNYTFGPFRSRAAGAPKTGHYTQMVWADTTHLGCAISKWKEGKWTKYFVVCNYGPPGNYINKVPYVSNKKGSQNVVCTIGKDKCTKPFGDSCPRN